MKIEPPISHPDLLARVDDLYRLPTRKLSFLPEGECGVSFSFVSGGRKFFLKLWPDDRVGRAIRARLSINLPLIDELYRRGYVPNLPAPIPTTGGKLYSFYKEYALALFPFAEGRPLTDLEELPSNEVLAQVAQAMANLHRATRRLREPLPALDPFAIPFGAELRRGLAELEAIGQTGSRQPAGRIRLGKLLLPRRATLLAELARLEQMQPAARQGAQELVLCHTDMGGNNVLIKPPGRGQVQESLTPAESWRVTILDWDDLILAPAEHDLHEYRGPGFSRFLQAYRQAGGDAPLSRLQFEFYLLRRYLADLTDWMHRVLYENSDPAQDASDLEGILRYCLPGLDHLEDELVEIERVL